MLKKLVLSLALLSGIAVVAPALSAEPHSLVDRLVAAQIGLLAPREPKTDPEALARAIAEASKGDRMLAAAMLTTAYCETSLSDRLRRNECGPKECDHRRAWGLYQIHKDQNTADVWGSPDANLQSIAAARKLKSAYYTAKAAHAPFPAGMFRLYAGRRADAPIPREALRISTFNLILNQL